MKADSPSTPQLPKVPDSWNFKDLGPLSVFLSNFSNALARELTRRIPKDVATDQVLLRSADGSVYSLTVSNTGAVISTIVYQSP